MWKLIKIVIPKVKVYWKELAFCMKYSIETVEAFDRDGKDLYESCLKLFIDWLNSSHGPTPKTYKTLLEHIKEVDNLTTASREIKMELIICKDK